MLSFNLSIFCAAFFVCACVVGGECHVENSMYGDSEYECSSSMQQQHVKGNTQFSDVVSDVWLASIWEGVVGHM